MGSSKTESRNKINDLRDHLFETLEALKDPEKPMDIDRAKAVADVARVIVESAKVEVDMLKVTGERSGTGFIPEAAPESVRRLSAAPGGARADEGRSDRIFAPVAANLRARAAEYRAKGMHNYADELEREAADAEFIAKAFGGPTDTSERRRMAKATSRRG